MFRSVAISCDMFSRHPALAVPGFSGECGLLATQFWHCQGFLAFATQIWHCQGFLACSGFLPSSISTARDFWRGRPWRHSALALPMLSGADAPNATQSWHCQGDPTNKKRSYSRPFRRISLMHELYLRVLNRFAASLANDDSCRASQYVHGPCQ